jgi:hypothetical protein
MLRHCQHKLAFSKSNWYTCALNAILSNTEKRVLKYQCRPTATLASMLKPNDNNLSSFIIPPPPLQPLQTTPEPLQTTPEPLQITLEPVVPVKKVKSKHTYRQCNGFRAYDGQRCRRLVRPTSASNSTGEILCFNHDPTREKKGKTKKSKAMPKLNSHSNNEMNKEQRVLREKRIFSTPKRIYDCWHCKFKYIKCCHIIMIPNFYYYYLVWIGKHIKKEQSTLLRQEMEKPISKRDKPGFIYAYALSQGPRASFTSCVYFKIGRTINPHRRMYQVSNVCKMEPKIIELFPSFPISGTNHLLPTNLEILERKLVDIPKCPLSHRVERLIHLELSSLYNKAAFKCQCGSTHREWIKVNRLNHPDGKPMTDHELWLYGIRPVITKWVQYGVVASAVNNSFKEVK